MHNISKSAIIPYSTKQMYDLVNDIENYQKFLNWCDNSKILDKKQNQINASISVNKGFFKQQFSTKNTLIKNQQITMELINGPFKTLVGNWSFNQLRPNACKIIFELKFEFKSRLIDISLCPAFSQIASTQLDSFIKRAKDVYG